MRVKEKIKSGKEEMETILETTLLSAAIIAVFVIVDSADCISACLPIYIAWFLRTTL
jgi:hypothetical protein